MASLTTSETFASGSGNVAGAEKWLSLLAGTALTLSAFRRGGVLSRLLLATSGASLLSRGATGYCAIKGALSGQTSIKEGFQEQWNRTRSALTAAPKIDSMDTLYRTELQELQSAESQFQSLLQFVQTTVDNQELKQRLQTYAQDIQSRAEQVRTITRSEALQQSFQRSDEAMQALVSEVRKMARIAEPAVRDAALVSALQRVIHYKIAGYGTIASYASALGYVEEASRFAEQSERDKSIDSELTELAKSTVNPQARAVAGKQQAYAGTSKQSTQSVRTH